MGARGLTAKQQRFAELLASGSTKVDAFRQAYPSGQRTKETEWEGAKRVSRHPAVVAEVQRLTLLRSPHDAVAQTEHIAARLIELSKSEEPSVALRAIAAWTKLAEAGLLKAHHSAAEQGNVAAEHGERARIIEELEELYAKALGPSWQQRNELVQSNAESIEEAGDQSENDDASINEAPGSSKMEPQQSFDGDPIDLHEAGGPMAPDVLIDASAESLRRRGNYELVPIPGSFPPKYRKVRRLG